MAKETVGGQAVIEGVMIKKGDNIAIAVRRPDKKIEVKKEKVNFPKINIPFIRGIINLVLILYIGIKALNYSSNIALEEETGEKESLGFFTITFTILFSFAFAIFLFKFIPLGIAQLLDNIYHFNNILFNIIDGLVKIGIFALYVYLIGLMSDIKRVYEYHGAEHKVVNCYEAGKKLTLKNIKKFSTLHPRCGTTFVFLVLFLSIIVYTFIPKDYSFLAKFGWRILLLPVVAGIAYEVLKFGGKHSQNIFMKIFISPGLLMQKVTTREPDDLQIEVAIHSIKAVLKA